MPPVFDRAFNGDGVAQSVHGHHAAIGPQVTCEGHVQFFKIFSKPVGQFTLDAEALRQDQGKG